MSEELKPCPFCEATDSFVERADFSSCYVICNDCGARGPTSCDETETDARATEADECEPVELAARRLWNRGAIQPSAPEQIAESANCSAERAAKAHHDFRRQYYSQGPAWEDIDFVTRLRWVKSMEVALASIQPSEPDIDDELARISATADREAMKSAIPLVPKPALTVEEWNCRYCRCKTYAVMDEMQADGSFGPGPFAICVECKVQCPNPEQYVPTATLSASRAKAFEEAAKIAETLLFQSQDTKWDTGVNDAKQWIATAIRQHAKGGR